MVYFEIRAGQSRHGSGPGSGPHSDADFGRSRTQTLKQAVWAFTKVGQALVVIAASELVIN